MSREGTTCLLVVQINVSHLKGCKNESIVHAYDHGTKTRLHAERQDLSETGQGQSSYLPWVLLL